MKNKGYGKLWGGGGEKGALGEMGKGGMMMSKAVRSSTNEIASSLWF